MQQLEASASSFEKRDERKQVGLAPLERGPQTLGKRKSNFLIYNAIFVKDTLILYAQFRFNL